MGSEDMAGEEPPNSGLVPISDPAGGGASGVLASFRGERRAREVDC